MKPAREAAAGKRGSGRPKTPQAATETAVEATMTLVKKPVGRPKTKTRRPVKAAEASETNTKTIKSTKGFASEAKGAKASIEMEDVEEKAPLLLLPSPTASSTTLTKILKKRPLKRQGLSTG